MSEVTWSGKDVGVPRFEPMRGRGGWWVMDRATGEVLIWYRTWDEAHERAELLLAEAARS